MRYLIRSAKYFAAFCVLYLGIVWLSVMTSKGMDVSVWDYVAATFATTRGKMLGLAVVVLSALYPRMGFMTRRVECDMQEEHDYLLRVFAAAGFTLKEESDGRMVFNNIALNDAVICKGTVARVVSLQVNTGAQVLGVFEGDGVVVATPTGSTGYSLSAGGPIVEPTAQNFVISPVCVHTVFSKSFVLSAGGVVTVTPASSHRKQVYLSVDGGKAFSLRYGDQVRISRSRYSTDLMRLTDKSIYEILGNKMTGGIGHEK